MAVDKAGAKGIKSDHNQTNTPLYRGVRNIGVDILEWFGNIVCAWSGKLSVHTSINNNIIQP
jgi:hypothetical protein